MDNELGRGEGQSKLWLLVVDMDLVVSWSDGIKFRFLSIPVWVSLIQRVAGLLMRGGVVDMVMVALSWVVALAFFSCCLVAEHFVSNLRFSEASFLFSSLSFLFSTFLLLIDSSRLLFLCLVS